MDDPKKQLVERLKQAQNVLVTVSANPSVDQLAAAIGLTLVLNHLDKHGTAVYSGRTPSTLEFLRPEETLEKNTDSLRDFIIALDKSKADKLRYKVEDDVVRIFITPYRTSIDQSDLDFSQGDFNVDVVIALGVKESQDLDSAITAHGRILHDATVVSINTEQGSELGTIQWTDTNASSLCELVVQLTNLLDKSAFDSQMATALLTGIVAATDRFSNDRTSPNTMSASAALMAAGANQQLIATQLQVPEEAAEDDMPADDSNEASDDAAAQEKPKPEPGTLEIQHEGDEHEPKHHEEPDEESDQPQVDVDENGSFINQLSEDDEPKITAVHSAPAEGHADTSSHAPAGLEDTPAEYRSRMVDPPQLSGTLTANSSQHIDEDTDSESTTQPSNSLPLLSHNEAVLPDPVADAPGTPIPPAASPLEPYTPQPPQVFSAPAPVITPEETLSEIENQVHSPHLQQAAPPLGQSDEPTDVNDARSAVEAALQNNATDPLRPISALNAQPLGNDLHTASVSAPEPYSPPAVTNTGFNEPTPGNTPADQTLDMPLPGTPLGPQAANIQPSNPLPPQPQSTYQPSSQGFTAPNNASLPSSQPPPSTFPGMPPQSTAQDPNAPPPVPPPMLPPLQ